MKNRFLLCIFVFFFLIAANNNFVTAQTSSTMQSESFVDWTKSLFTSSVVFDIERAGITFPAGRSSADEKIVQSIPLLVKNPLLTLAVDSSTLLGDSILRDTITLEQVINIIDNGICSPSYFSKGLSELKLNHQLSLKELSELMVFHNAPYTPKTPIERVPSRIYTGIVIDARGSLPVHGEFSTDTANPCMFPKIWDDSMDLLYERNMVDANLTRQNGIVTYAYANDESSYRERIGHDPLRIAARKIFGVYRTDPVISRKDALKILSIPENRELLRQGKVVILLDKDALVHAVSSPKKTDEYYVKYRDVENFYYERKIPDVSIKDGPRGMLISIENIKFIADSAKLLTDETERLDNIALALKQATKDGGFTILVEGHTANVGKPTGEMNLSIERAKTIINEMVKRGVPNSLFSYKGYGGTAPVADNSTSDGRAQNRRVEINVMPQQTYVQRLP